MWIYAEKIYILKQGKLEVYLGSSNKKIDTVIAFCQNIEAWLSVSNDFSDEIKDIITKISK